ncbi:DUF378 domain-containing protein [Anaerocolumna sedimenticola]|uniref:DUF378 domain-containing protein n=1 Tax=Anaerocolumna sedimenticola TaxID=2696063 RepID=UPI002FE6E6E7
MQQKGGNQLKTVDYIALCLVIIGAINWGLIGFLGFDLVRVIFGDMTWISRVIYAVVGIAGLYALSYFGRLRNE